MLTFEQIKELIDLVSERDLQGVEVERSGCRLRIDGKTKTIAAPEAEAPAPGQPGATRAEPAPVAAAGGVESAPTEAVPLSDSGEPIIGEGLKLMRSPIVGTFYTSPSPDAEPYVRAGDRVKRGQVLCIVEAMKLMNEIESDEDGVIEKIYPKNAQPVEYGEPLFIVRPD